MSESTPVVVASSEMMDMKDVMSMVRAKAPATPAPKEEGDAKKTFERKPYVNKKSPTYIQDYYEFGKKVRDHIKYMKMIREKEDATDFENRSIASLSDTIRRVVNFLGFKPFGYVRFVEYPLKDLYHELIRKSGYEEEISMETIDYWMGMEVNYKILFNTLISIFTYRRNLGTDVRIGEEKLRNFFFLNAVIQFAFSIHEDQFPTNLEFYKVCSALAVLANEKKNFTIENVNSQLEKEDTDIRISSDNQSLDFFKDRCYGNKA